MERTQTKSERWNLRVTPNQAAIVQAALAVSGESLNDFVARAAVTEAEAALADRRVFMLEDAAWNDLERVMRRPAKRIPALAKLMRQTSVFDR